MNVKAALSSRGKQKMSIHAKHLLDIVGQVDHINEACIDKITKNNR